jgi:protein FAM32A
VKAAEKQRVKELLFKESDDAVKDSPSGSARNSPVPGHSGTRKTEAEKRFENAQRERVRVSSSDGL